MSQLKFEVVSMEKVPDPPVCRGGGRYADLYDALRKLGLGEKSAVKVGCRDAKHLAAMRASLRKKAEADGKMLCSSRNVENTEAYFWLAKKAI